MIISLVLDVVLNFFYPTTIMLSYVISISRIIKYKFNKNLYMILFISVIYDLIFTDRIFLHTFIFLLVITLIRKYKKINIYLLALLSFILYYLILSLFSMNFNLLNIINLLTINYLIFLLTYFILKRIYNIR